MGNLSKLLYITLVSFSLASCVERAGTDPDSLHVGDRPSGVSDEIRAMFADYSPVTESRTETKSLVDRITTKELQCQFLRIDENIDDNTGDGLYTFDYSHAMLVQAKSISSPDNTQYNLRGITFNPAQTYKIRIKSTPDGHGDFTRDTTHFYHTRMVGWYPRDTVNFPERKDGKIVYDYLDNHPEMYTVKNGKIAIHFENLLAEDDVMVTDLKEAQHWHSANPAKSPGGLKDNDHYSVPFGYNSRTPKYLNYFKFKHYRSAIRVYAHTVNSDNDPTMWGKILGVSIVDQPTSCDIVLPYTVTPVNNFDENLDEEPFFSGGDPEDVTWGDYQNLDIVTTPMFSREDSNADPELCKEVDFDQIDLSGKDADKNVYLGYSMIEPERDVTIEVQTTSGVYTVTVPHRFKVDEGFEDIFLPSYYYTIVINFTTTGTVAEILQKEADEYYYDLTARSVLKESANPEDVISGYAFSNCYIVDPDPATNDRLRSALATLNEDLGLNGTGNEKTAFDGYAFCAIKAGNDNAGILNSRFVPSNASIVPYSARLIWESADDGEPGLVTDVALKHNYVRFRTASNRRGNAVIAVYDDNDRILWSWHIWVTDSPGDVELGGYKFLDRNLGATSNATEGNRRTYGLYYQWGRKDPSMGPPGDTYSITSMITWPYHDFSYDRYESAEVKFIPAPTLQDARDYPQYLLLPSSPISGYDYNWMSEDITLLWGHDAATSKDHKSLYDPCPFGYKVPSGELETAIRSTGRTARTRGVSYGGLFLPFAGFKGEDLGSNTINAVWTDVGKAGDYQTSVITNSTSTERGGHSYWHHRGRVMLYNAASWQYKIGSESTWNNYDSPYVDFGWTNRRTAASVRCVKEQEIYASLNTTFTMSSKLGSEDRLTADDVLTFNYSADSYNSVLTNLDIDVEYVTTDGVNIKSSLFSKNSGLSVSSNGSIKFNVQDADYLAGVSPAGYRFTFTAVNSNGIRDTKTISMVNGSFSSALTQIRNHDEVPDGVSTTKNSTNVTWTGTTFDITLTGTSSKNISVTSVDIKDGGTLLATIDGNNGTSISEDNSGTDRITTMSTGVSQWKIRAFTSGGIRKLTAVYHLNGGATITSTFDVKVWAEKDHYLGDPLTSPSFDNSLKYVIVHRQSGAYLRGVETRGLFSTNYSFQANAGNAFDPADPDNHFLFTINGNTPATFQNPGISKFVSGQTNISAADTGQTYTVSYTQNQGFRMYFNKTSGNNKGEYVWYLNSSNNLAIARNQTGYWEIRPYYENPTWVSPENIKD